LNNGAAVNWVTTTADTAIAVANSISQYAPTTGFYAIASVNTVLIYAVTTGTSTNNLTLSVTVNVNTSANNYNICIGNCAITFSGAGSGSAFAVSQITAGATNLLAASVSQASISAMVNALAIGINAHGTGYCANSVGATLYISKATTVSTDAAITITPTTGTGITAGASSGGSATISLSTYAESTTFTRHIEYETCSGSYQPDPISVIIGGITNPPYTYQWNLVSNGFTLSSEQVGAGTNCLPLVSTTNYQAVFDTRTLTNSVAYVTTEVGSVNAVYNCTVTDSSGVAFTTADVVITVYFVNTTSQY
jgi:hypothetical protein